MEPVLGVLDERVLAPFTPAPHPHLSMSPVVRDGEVQVDHDKPKSLPVDEDYGCSTWTDLDQFHGDIWWPGQAYVESHREDVPHTLATEYSTIPGYFDDLPPFGM